MIHYIIGSDNQERVDTVIFPMLHKMGVKGNISYDTIKCKSMFKIYNNALDYLDLKDDDVVVFMHDDIEIRDIYFEKKLELYFQYRQNIGIAGVIGTTLFTDGGGWWMCDRSKYTRGRIIQGFPDGKEHWMEEFGGMDEKNIISIDGCIMFMCGKVAKHFRFDSDTYDGFHFYDVDTCFTLLKQGYDIGIIDTTIYHQSEGPLSQGWLDNKSSFYKKWANIPFPATIHNFKNI